MKRRNFIKTGSLLSAPFFLNGFPLFAKGSLGSEALDLLAKGTINCGKVLVIIQQNGGNDGLNTIIPLDKYPNLAAARANILLPQPSVLTLSGNATTGMHPAMSGLQNLYNNGKVAIVQGVSYPNPSFSHFRATDIWFSGSASNVTLDTGWLGRTLDVAYTGYPGNYPNTTMPDPLAVQIGSLLPFSLQGPNVNMGYNVSNPNNLLNVLNQTTDPAPNTDYGYELSFLRLMKDQSNAYTQRIQTAYSAQQTVSTLYPATGNSLADQLKIVARLIGGGLQTPIYIVNHPRSHDTHSSQVDPNNTTLGNHAVILSMLSEAITAFQDDMEGMGKDDKVSGMTFSEFGRRIISNASLGTDHGSAAPVLFFGKNVNGGMIGTSPNLPAAATVSDQVPMQYDFRQLYASVIEQWFCMTSTDANTVLGNSFSTLNIFKTTVGISDYFHLVGQYLNGQAQLSWDVTPNNKYDRYQIEFSTGGGNYELIGTNENTSAANSAQYQFTHVTRVPKMYYRIAAITKDGQTEYSNILALRSNPEQQLVSIFPNPVKNHTIYVNFHEPVDSAIDITIYDLMGAKVYYDKRKLQGSQGMKIQVPDAFNSFMHYILELRYDQEVVREQLLFE